MPERAQILPGTLDWLILKAVPLAPLCGYGILLRINRRTKFDELTIPGRKRLAQEEEGWNRLVARTASALKARREETGRYRLPFVPSLRHCSVAHDSKTTRRRVRL